MKCKPQQFLLKSCTFFFLPHFIVALISEGKSGIQIILRKLFKYLQQTVCVFKCLPEQKTQNMHAVTV